MPVFKFTLTFLLLCFGSVAYSGVELKEQDINVIFNKIEEGIHQFEDGAQVWGVKLLSAPEGLGGIEFITSDSYRVLTQDGKNVGIFLYRLETTLEYSKDSKQKSWNFKWSPVAWQGIRYHNCGQGAPRLVAPKDAAPVPFYVMMACSLSDNKYFMTITYDPRADIALSSIFELSGKGDSYKHYEVPASKPGTVFGNLKFSFEESSYDLSFYLTKESNRNSASTAAVVRNTIMLGTANMSVSSPDFSVSNSKYTLNYEFLSAPVLKNLQLGGQANQSFALSNGSGSSDLNRTWVTGYLHYEFFNKNNWFLAARVIGGLLSFQDSVSGLNLTSFQLGYGLNVHYDLRSNQRINFGLDKVGMMSDSVKDHLAISAQYQYQLLSGHYIGLGYISNSFKAVNATGVIRNFTSNDLLLTYGF